MLRWVTVKLITWYRRTGGGYRWFAVECNFKPSCSAYAREAIERFGLYRGGMLTWRRLRRCNRRDSFCKCIEPVPETWDADPSGS